MDLFSTCRCFVLSGPCLRDQPPPFQSSFPSLGYRPPVSLRQETFLDPFNTKFPVWVNLSKSSRHLLWYLLLSVFVKRFLRGCRPYVGAVFRVLSIHPPPPSWPMTSGRYVPGPPPRSTGVVSNQEHTLPVRLMFGPSP